MIFDIFVALPLVIFAICGCIKGSFKFFFRPFGWIISVAAGVALPFLPMLTGGELSTPLDSMLGEPIIGAVVIALVLIFVIRLLIFILFGTIRKIKPKTGFFNKFIAFWDHLFGFVFGAIVGAVIGIVLCALFDLTVFFAPGITEFVGDYLAGGLILEDSVYNTVLGLAGFEDGLGGFLSGILG